MTEEALVLSVLVHDENTDDVERLQNHLTEIESGWSVEFHVADDEESFRAALEQNEFHIVFLKDLIGPDRSGMDVLKRLRRSGYRRPVVLVVKNGDEQYAARAFRNGVNDYLMMDALSSEELERSIEYVLKDYFQYDKDEFEDDKLLLFERRDSLTGFYNRVSLVNQLNALYRQDQNLVLVLIGISNLERVNEVHGQEVGDRVIKQLGNEIRETFQDEDVIGRVQGGEFCVVIEGKGQGYAKEEARSLLGRLEDNRLSFDQRNSTPLNFVGCTIQKGNDSKSGQEFLRRGIDKLHQAKAGELEARIKVAGK